MHHTEITFEEVPSVYEVPLANGYKIVANKGRVEVKLIDIEIRKLDPQLKIYTKGTSTPAMSPNNVKKTSFIVVQGQNGNINSLEPANIAVNCCSRGCSII